MLGRFQKSQQAFPHLGAYLRMRYPFREVPEVRQAQGVRSNANDSQACCESAEKVWADSKKLKTFPSLGVYQRMRFPLPEVREVRDA